MSNAKPDTEPHSFADGQPDGQPNGESDRKPHGFPNAEPHTKTNRLCGERLCRVEPVF